MNVSKWRTQARRRGTNGRSVIRGDVIPWAAAGLWAWAKARQAAAVTGDKGNNVEELDFLDGDKPSETTAAVQEPAPAPTPEPTATEAQGPARGPDGKFLPREQSQPETVQAAPPPQAPAPTPEAVQPQPEPLKVPDGYVPVAALQEIRREFQAFKQSIAQQPALPPPDPYEDIEGYQAHVQDQIAATKFSYSQRLLVATQGQEVAEQVQSWAAQKANEDPIFYQRALSTEDPFGFALSEWKRDQVLTRLSADPRLLDSFLSLASGQAAPAPQPGVQAPIPQPPTPPRSLASAPSAGGSKPGETPAYEGAAFDSIFRS